MEKGRRLLLPLVLLAFSCTVQKDVSDMWPYGVRYEIFVLSFADSNGDGKGDIKGLTEKLSYLQDFGIKAVWLMPVMNSPSYHKYDVTDYKSIHPDYGTIEEFKTFVSEAHRRDIKVVIDLILNHTSSEHPWFLSAKTGSESPYRDYYVWAKKDSVRAQISKRTTSFDSDNITQWHAANGDTTAQHYYGFFWGGMPDLNFDNIKVRREFLDIGKFWLKDIGVDGFRFDAAKHIFTTDRAPENHAFWQEFRRELEAIKPDVYLVGEVWSDAQEVAPYLSGIPSLFNFDMGYAITNTVNAGKDTMKLISKYKEITDFYKSVTPSYMDATFLKNHDQNRILTELGGNRDKMRVAAGLLLTLPGTPFLYYGEEIGMVGAKPDEYIREPFIWDTKGKDPAQTSWEQARYSSDTSVISLEQQKKDPLSLYNCYRKLIHNRNSSEALTRGDLAPSPIDIREVVSFKRISEKEVMLVLHNVSDVEVTIPMVGELTGFDQIVFELPGNAKLTGGEMKLPAYSTVILN
ncbi:MAG: alpha-amylase family glycosyl hydrolase [Chryseolinea sp.]